jgi:hypothetical protein
VFDGVKFCEITVKAIATKSIAFTSFQYQELAYNFCVLYGRVHLAHDRLTLLGLVGYIFSPIKSLQALHIAHDTEIYRNRLISPQFSH